MSRAWAWFGLVLDGGFLSATVGNFCVGRARGGRDADEVLLIVAAAAETIVSFCKSFSALSVLSTTKSHAAAAAEGPRVTTCDVLTGSCVVVVTGSAVTGSKL